MNAAFFFRRDPSASSFDDGAPAAVMDAGCAVRAPGARMTHRAGQGGMVRIGPVRVSLATTHMRHRGLRPDAAAVLRRLLR